MFRLNPESYNEEHFPEDIDKPPFVLIEESV